MKPTILLLNGPNLNLLGGREPEIYGASNLQDVELQLKDFFQSKGLKLLSFQSNHEGELIDFLHQNKTALYCIANPGGLSHTSISLRDAFAAVQIPLIEVHISNIYSREEFRQHSLFSEIASGVITGCGIYGYQLAAQLIDQRISKE